MDDKLLITQLNHDLETNIPEGSSSDQLRGALGDYLNDLILNDFQKLLRLLYKIDVDETKLKKLLSDNPTSDAGQLITNLIIERQLQKIETRKKYSGGNTPEEERW